MGALSAGLPDEAALTRLANEFFRELPGQPPAAVYPVEPPPAAHPVEPAPPIHRMEPPAQPPHAAQPAPAAQPPPQPAVAGFAPPSPIAAPGLATNPPELLSTPPEWPGPAFVPPGGGLAAPSFYFVDEPPATGPAAGPATAGPAAYPASPDALFDVETVRRQFPILSERINGRQLVWLDNAATTQKPQVVIDRLSYFYAHENSNIHRAAHTLAARATDAYEAARATIADFIGAPSSDTIVYTRGATEAINLVAQAWGRQNIRDGDEILISHLEHHANIVPWQQLAEQVGATLKVIPVDDEGQLLLDAYTGLLSDRTRLVAVSHVSNTLGTIVPVSEVIEGAHRAGARVLIDGAQAVAHLPTDVRGLDADFYVFSGHKVFAPTGIGVLYGKPELLETMPPWQGGGNMIRDVTFERTTYQGPPARFEAGTGSIGDAVTLGTALDFVRQTGLPAIARYEHDLLGYALGELQAVPGLRLIGTAPAKASVLSFVLDGYRPEDVGSALDQEGIAVRAGHHCAQPILRRYGLESTVRASLAMYNTCGEVDLLAAALHRLAADAGSRR